MQELQELFHNGTIDEDYWAMLDMAEAEYTLAYNTESYQTKLAEAKATVTKLKNQRINSCYRVIDNLIHEFEDGEDKGVLRYLEDGTVLINPTILIPLEELMLELQCEDTKIEYITLSKKVSNHANNMIKIIKQMKQIRKAFKKLTKEEK